MSAISTPTIKKKTEHSPAFVRQQEEWANQEGNRAYRRAEASRKRHEPFTKLKWQLESDRENSKRLRALKVQNRIKKVQERKAERLATGKLKIKLRKKRLKIAEKNKRKQERMRLKRAKNK